MARDTWEPTLGTVDVEEDLAVVVRTTPEGERVVVIVPKSVQRLSEEAHHYVSEMQRRVALIGEMRDELDVLAVEARDAGASWGAIGWSTGMSPQAARKRWGDG